MCKTAWLLISIVISTNLGLYSVAQSNANDKPQVPTKLQVPTDRQLVFKSVARGSQIYICQQQPADRSQYEWKLKAPAAQLFDERGKVIGKHYAGPTWEANDGSKIAAVAIAKDKSPIASIPWWLLQVKSAEGNGKFTNIKWVQRLHTTGGNSPKDCNRGRQNAEIAVPYTADYYFYSDPKRP